MKILVRKDVYDELCEVFGIEKSHGRSHEYISKKMVNGHWVYKYKDYEKKVVWHKEIATKRDFRQFIQDSLNNAQYQESILVDRLSNEAKTRIEKASGFRPTNLVIESDFVRHSVNNPNHKITTEDLLLIRKIINDKSTVIKKEANRTRTMQVPVISFTKYQRGKIIFQMTFRGKFDKLCLETFYRPYPIV